MSVIRMAVGAVLGVVFLVCVAYGVGMLAYDVSTTEWNEEQVKQEKEKQIEQGKYLFEKILKADELLEIDDFYDKFDEAREIRWRAMYPKIYMLLDRY